MNPFKMKAGVSLSSLALWMALLAISVVPFRAAAQVGTTTVWDWGFNAYGQLGNNTLIDSNVPTSTVPAIEWPSEVAGGGFHSLALVGTSTIWAWGDNVFGQLGDATFVPRRQPVQVASTWYGDPIGIAAGAQHSLAIAVQDGTTTVWAWGSNDFGQLGDGSATLPIPPPIPVPIPVIENPNVGTFFPSFPKTATAIAAGKWHSLALTVESATTTVWAWGNNDFGQLGDGTFNTTSTPVQVDGLLTAKTVTAIAAGDRHSLALANGRVYAWGNNDFGQLGDGTYTTTSTPIEVTGLLEGKTVIAIAAGAFHSLALDSGGVVYAWGDNAYGQLGNNSTITSNVPVLVATPPTNVKRIAAGTEHSLALTDDGTVTVLWAWGYYWGIRPSLIPVQVDVAGYNVVNGTSTIEGGDHHSLAIFRQLPDYHTTTVETTLSTPSIRFGQSVFDEATVTSVGGGAVPTGIVRFYYQANSTSTLGWTWFSDGTLGSGGTTTSSDFKDTAVVPGTYYFQARYVGDPRHGSSESTIDEKLVYYATTTINTSLSKKVIYAGSLVTDTVTINNAVPGWPNATGQWQVEATLTPNDPASWSSTGLPGGTLNGKLPITFTTPAFGSAFTRGLWFIRVHYFNDPAYYEIYSGNWEEILIVL